MMRGVRRVKAQHQISRYLLGYGLRESKAPLCPICKE